jgi:hypothetical protein
MGMIGLTLGAAAIGAITGRTHYLLSEIEIPARAPTKFDLRSLADVEALASLVEEEEVVWTGFRELVDEILPALQAEAAAVAADTAERGCPPDVRHSRRSDT